MSFLRKPKLDLDGDLPRPSLAIFPVFQDARISETIFDSP